MKKEKTRKAIEPKGRKIIFDISSQKYHHVLPIVDFLTHRNNAMESLLIKANIKTCLLLAT